MKMNMDTETLKKYIRTSESKTVDVLFWILDNLDENNYLHGTLDSISQDCKVTKMTINSVFQKLYKAGFMTKVRNGKYHIDLDEQTSA